MSNGSTTLFNYSIFCNTENFPVYGYGTSPPTQCYNNATHSVNLASVQKFGQIQLGQTIIQNETNPTGGHFGTQSYVFTAAPSTVTTYSVSFPFPITPLTGSVQVTSDMVGDSIDIVRQPQTVAGTLSLNATAPATQLTVSSTVIQNTYVGLYAYLSDGTNLDSLGRILSINTTNNTVVVETPTVHNFSSTTPTFFLVTNYYVKNHQFRTVQIHSYGYSKIGGQAKAPTGAISELIYTNNSASPKTVCFWNEFFY